MPKVFCASTMFRDLPLHTNISEISFRRKVLWSIYFIRAGETCIYSSFLFILNKIHAFKTEMFKKWRKILDHFNVLNRKSIRIGRSKQQSPYFCYKSWWMLGFMMSLLTFSNVFAKGRSILQNIHTSRLSFQQTAIKPFDQIAFISSCYIFGWMLGGMSFLVLRTVKQQLIK